MPRSSRTRCSSDASATRRGGVAPVGRAHGRRRRKRRRRRSPETLAERFCRRCGRALACRSPAPRATARSISAAMPQPWHSRNGALRQRGPSRLRADRGAAAHPARAPARADRRRSAEPGRPGDRAAPARPARRGRLSARRARRGRGSCSAATSARVEAVLARLQEFDPPGVFARDLPECLALQLRDRNRLDPAMQALLDNLPLLAARNVAALMRRLPGRRRRPRRDDRRDQIARPAARPRLRPAAGAAGRPRHPDAGAARGRLDRRAEQPTPCRACWSTTAITRGSAGRRATRPSATI